MRSGGVGCEFRDEVIGGEETLTGAAEITDGTGLVLTKVDDLVAVGNVDNDCGAGGSVGGVPILGW